MKRSPIRRGKPLQRKTPMRRGRVKAWNSTLGNVSPKQAAKNRKRKPVRDAYLAAHLMCETDCGQRAVDVHEPWTRKRGGPIDDPRNFMAVCRECHDWIHGHADEATEQGWLVKAEFGPEWLAAGGPRWGREAAA